MNDTKTLNAEYTAATKHRSNDIGEFLRKMLAAGPAKVVEIEATAQDAGLLGEKPISQSKPFRNARRRLGVEPYQEGGQWWWSLPAGKQASGKAPARACESPIGLTENKSCPKNGPGTDVAPVPAEKTKKRHGERGPGVKTLLTKAALDAAAANADLSPTEFLLSVMRDQKAEARWRMEAAKALLPVNRLPTLTLDRRLRASDSANISSAAHHDDRAVLGGRPDRHGCTHRC